MADYQEYIGALRKCAKEHENDRTSTGQIIVSNLCEVIADLLEDLSSSGKPNKSIEEKCPCYYCEHFEIKGWSHCKIHEGAYGDSRCNDYHKIKQEPNKSENPTGSDDCISRAEAQTEIEMNASRYTIAKERCGMGQVEWSDQLIKVSDAVDIIRELPSVTPQEPRKGHWTEEFNDLEGEVRFTCSSCGKYQLFGTDFCYHCGSDNREVVEE